VAIIRLGFGFPRSSSSLPGNLNGQSIVSCDTAFPYLALLHVGFTKPIRCRTAGALLPHLFNLTWAFRPSAVCFLLHFPSLAGPRVTRHNALWSSDFPLWAIGPGRSPVCLRRLS